MKSNYNTLLVLLPLLGFCFSCSPSATVGPVPPTPTPAPVPTPTPAKPSQVSSFTGVYEMTSIAYGTLPEVKGVGSLTVTALSDTTVRIDQVRSLTLVSTGESESRTSRDTCTISSNSTYSANGVSYKPFAYSRTKAGAGTWGYISVPDAPRTALVPETMDAVKKIPAYKDRTPTQVSYYTRKP